MRSCAVQDRSHQEKEHFRVGQVSPRNTQAVLHPHQVLHSPGEVQAFPPAPRLLLARETITSSKNGSRELGGNSGTPLKEKKYFQLTLSTHLFSAPKFSEQMYNKSAEWHRGKKYAHCCVVCWFFLLKITLFPSSYIHSKLKTTDLVSFFRDQFRPSVHLC